MYGVIWLVIIIRSSELVLFGDLKNLEKKTPLRKRMTVKL